MSEERLASTVLDAAWRNILETNIPAETHPLQVKTYKRFFYAGAKALIDNLILTDTLDEGTEDLTPQDAKRIDAIIIEVQSFFAEVLAGRQ
jgi:hypothetical protein